jgi:hypothetical protein
MASMVTMALSMAARSSIEGQLYVPQYWVWGVHDGRRRIDNDTEQ